MIKLKISFALEKSFSSRISDLLAILEFEGIKLNGFFIGSKNVFSDFTTSTTLFCVLVTTFLISLFSLISLDLTGSIFCKVIVLFKDGFLGGILKLKSLFDFSSILVVLISSDFFSVKFSFGELIVSNFFFGNINSCLFE